MDKKTIWFDARNLKNEESILQFIYNLNFKDLLIKSKMIGKIRQPGRMNLIVQVDSLEEIEDLKEGTTILSNDINILTYASERNFKTALYYLINDRKSMDEAWMIGSQFDYMVVDFVDTTNIPLELLIARMQNSKTIILKRINSYQDMMITFGVMEVGSGGVLVNTEDDNEIFRINSYIEDRKIGKIELLKGTVVDVQHVGMGNRVCIDTTSILKENEGMIIGSTSEGGLLVSSETHYLPYMELRPFRVNAGAVHSYVWIPDGETAYLTELKAGSPVLCVDINGNTREVVVGRVKIEKRPLLKIEVESNGKRLNTIVQDDWHIRIFGANGDVRNASTIQIGDELLTYVCSGGRHVGIKIDETIQEK